MEDNITGSTQWVQSYDSFHSPLPFSDATSATTGVDSTSLSPNNSHRAKDHLHQQHQLSPKSTGGVSKPIRRRSRASKRTPITLLNANTTNFRALVQQFTGCPRAPISFATQKGPITLNFGAGTANSSSYSENFRDKFYRQRPLQQEDWSQQNEQQQQQQQYQQEEEEEHYSMEQIFDNISISNDASNSTTSPNILDGFSMDELTMEYLFSNGYS